MAVNDVIYAVGTYQAAAEIRIHRGTVSDIETVGVYFTALPGEVPALGDYIMSPTGTVQLVDGTEEPPPALAEGSKIDIAFRIGPSADVTLTPGRHYGWARIKTASEDLPYRIGWVDVQ